MNNKNSGFSAVLVVLLVAALGVGGYFVYSQYFMKPAVIQEPAPGIAPVVKNGVQKEDDFAKVEEPQGTPAEINNQSLDELDQLVKDIDNEAEEDLSDL